MYVGDDHKNDGIELVGRPVGTSTWTLIAVTVEKDKQGRYNVASFYPVSESKIQNRRQRGFLQVAKK